MTPQKLLFPVKDFQWGRNTSQLFGVNARVYMPSFGIPGHNGIDIVLPQLSNAGYGAEVVAAHDGKASVLPDSADHTKGNGIYVLDPSGKFSTIYWHLSKFAVKDGEDVKAGQVIGYVGNTGFVFPKKSSLCPFCGTHLHFAIRVWGLVNDYSGCVDPVPWLFTPGERLPLYLPRDLFYSCQGDDVSYLQTLLQLEGVLDTEPVGFFGNRTRKGVSDMQKKLAINPTLGYCGKITRKYLNQKYSDAPIVVNG